MRETAEARWQRLRAFDAGFGENICGMDEAGRGPLAGDVYAAAVVLAPDRPIPGLNDSKKLSESRREQLFDQICESAAAFAIAHATVEEIERLNILGAAMLAMQRAAAEITPAPALILVDGNRLPVLSVPAQCVVKGDAQSAAIAAASILAKVARDRTMREADRLYPMYGFARHKGYGTADHVAALRLYGPCPLHRPSFLRKILSE